MQRIYCFSETRPKSLSFAWRKGGNTGGEDRGALWEFVREWITHFYHLFNWPMCNHWKINRNISIRDYHTNETLKMLICFTESWLNDDTDNILLTGFSMYRQDRTATSGKTRGGGGGLFFNYSWCAMSNINKVLSYCRRVFIYIFRRCLFTTTNTKKH
jgi:hypothetical protein